jgi:hypothetical protein
MPLLIKAICIKKSVDIELVSQTERFGVIV